MALALDPVAASARMREHAALVEELAWNRRAASHTVTAENDTQNRDLRADALRALGIGLTIPESLARHLSDDFLQELTEANDVPATPGATQ